jgi:hypothetical protein
MTNLTVVFANFATARQETKPLAKLTAAAPTYQ